MSGASNHGVVTNTAPARENGEGLDPVAGVRHLLDLARRRKFALAAFALLGLGVAVASIGHRDPVYRATATVLIDEKDGQSGALGELSLFSAAPRASAEIAMLTSRTLAESVASPPPATRTDDQVLRHLDLRVEVDDVSRRPLTATFARLTGATPNPRIAVTCTSAEIGSPEHLRLRFVDERTLELASIGTLPYADAFGTELERVAWEPGRPVEWNGLELELELLEDRDPTGSTYVLHRRSVENAARALMGATRVMETQRNSGVLQLTVSDSDPRRAAAKANALCLNYFDQKVERSRRKASQSIPFIESQLEEQNALLEEVELELVELRREHPDLIDLTTSAGRIIERLSEFEVERLRIDLARRTLDEALELTAAGDDAGLSRLSADLSDPLSKGLVERLETLRLQRFAAEREDGGPYRTLLQQRASELDLRATEARLEFEALTQVIEAARDGEPGALAGLGGDGASGASVDRMTKGYLAELASLQARRDVLASTFTEEWPERRRNAEAIAELRERLFANLDQRAAALEALVDERTRLAADARSSAERQSAVDVGAVEDAIAQTRATIAEHLTARRDALDARHAQLVDVREELEAELEGLPAMERLLAEPLRRLQTHTELAALLMKSLQEAEIAQASALSSADFIDRAAVPSQRYAPRLGFTLAFGLIAGLVAGLGLLLVREQLTESLESEGELEALTGLPVLTSIPDFRYGTREAKNRKDFIALRDAPSGPVAEAYRSLRASLRFAVGDLANTRTLAVTSSAPSEGKSTTNVDLAWCLASPSRRVLLVDADLRRPSVHRYLRLDDRTGLAESLMGRANWRDHLQASGRNHLDVLVAGRSKGVSADLIGSEEMSGLIDEWLREYDMVVFDLPPALVVADVEVFAHRLDAVLLLYRAGGLPARAVENTAKRLRSAGANLVGLVMNACRPEKAKGAGAYGDYYKARSAYYDDERAVERHDEAA